MDDNDNKPLSWKKVDNLLRADANPVMPVTLGNKEALEAIPDEAERIKEQRLDLIGKIKSNIIERKTGLEMIRAMYEAQLDVGKHKLRRAVDVEKERVDLVANKYLYRLTEEYLHDMRELGPSNYNSRMDTLLRLNEETTKLLGRAEQQSVPSSIKDMTIDAIVKKHQEFYNRIIAEEMQLNGKEKNC